MITLITGTPGSGKTAWIVSELMRLGEPRPIYVDGIPELQVPHEVAPAISDWPSWAPDGALIIVDECQRVWRPRATGSRVPEDVAALETHRHRGIDFWIVTQSPTLVDANVRRLVGRHVHLVAKWAGRFAYEWPECKSDPGSVGDAVKRPYSLPKATFSQYKSATVHTKLEKRRPLAFYAVILASILVCLIGWRVFVRVDSLTSPAAPIVQGHGPTVDAPADAGGPGPLHVEDHAKKEDWRPRVNGRPETAPAYDHLRQVRDIPLPKGCVSMGSRCQCYTGQATPYPMTDAQCRRMVAGEFFNPYLDAGRVEAPKLAAAVARPGPPAPAVEDHPKVETLTADAP